jgi:hypothetical protein
MDKIDSGSRWNRPFNVNQEQPGPAEYAFSIIVGVAAMTLVGFMVKATGHSVFGGATGFLAAFPVIVGMNTLRARPETYDRNAFWGLRTLVFALAIMAGTSAMLLMQEFLVRELAQPWSGMAVYLVASYVVALPLLLTTERTEPVRLRRGLMYVYPVLAIVTALVMWLFDVTFG